MRIDALTSYAAVLLAALSLTACASRELAQETGDPFEPTNRAIFAVNQTLDDAVIGPGARAYDAVTPDPVQTGVRNFMTNLNQPVVFANALLQGDVHAAGDTFGRFLMNTTIGVAGNEPPLLTLTAISVTSLFAKNSGMMPKSDATRSRRATFSSGDPFNIIGADHVCRNKASIGKGTISHILQKKQAHLLLIRLFLQEMLV